MRPTNNNPNQRRGRNNNNNSNNSNHSNNGNNNRGRGRGGSSSGSNTGRQNYDSSGPNVRIRGSASQVYDKYAGMARDATTSGDPVLAESLYQHAEHYYRISAEQEAQKEARNNTRNNNNRTHEKVESVKVESQADEAVIEKAGADNDVSGEAVSQTIDVTDIDLSKDAAPAKEEAISDPVKPVKAAKTTKSAKTTKAARTPRAPRKPRVPKVIEDKAEIEPQVAE